MNVTSLESTYGVETEIICVDFSNDAIYEDVKTKLNGLDIGILGNQFLACCTLVINPI